MGEFRTSCPAGWITVSSRVVPGHQIASGLAPDSPYPAGSIDLQTPFFRDRGLSLDPYFPATLNLTIQPLTFRLYKPLYTFPQVEWTSAHPPETFSFCQCILDYKEQSYEGLVYYPHPETKRTHFQEPSLLEVLAPKIEGIAYGDRIQLHLNPTEIEVI